MRALFDRLLSLRSARSSGAAAETLPPALPADDATAATAERPVLLVSMLEVGPEEHPEILDKVMATFGASHKLVFLISTDAFGPFLARQSAIEYFMPIDQQILHRDLMDWPDYLAEKWALLLLKWRPASVIAYGMNVDRFLNAARAARAAGLP